MIYRSILPAVIILAGLGNNQPAFAQQPCAFGARPPSISVYDDPALGNSGPNDPGDYERKLLAALTYVDCKGVTHEVPNGFVHNGASVPRAFWTAIGYTPGDGRLERPAVLHDWMVSDGGYVTAESSKLFREALIAVGVPKRTAEAFFIAVEAAGPKRTVQGGPVTTPSLSATALRAWTLLVQLALKGQSVDVQSQTTAAVSFSKKGPQTVNSMTRTQYRTKDLPSAEDLEATQLRQTAEALAKLQDEQLRQLETAGRVTITTTRTTTGPNQ